jgi:HK97 family phage prohead protease
MTERHLPGKHNQDSHADGTGQAKAAADKLKLAGRIELKPGEKLVASDRVKRSSRANVTNVGMLAATDGPDGFRLRLGIVFNEDAGKWRGANRGGTLSMSKEDVAKVVDELESVDAKATDRAKLMKKQIAQFDQLADIADDKDRDPGDRAAAEAKLDALGEQMGDRDQVVAEGVIPAGEWGDLAFRVQLVDDDVGGKWGMDIAVRPPDAGDDWQISEEQALELDKATLKRMLGQLSGLGALGERGRSVAYSSCREVDTAMRTAMRPHTERSSLAEREVPFEMRSSSDGLTFEGYAAVFDSPTSIDSWEGQFDEVVARGAFVDTLRQRMPVLMFEHGKHPLIGTMPLGVIVRAAEDSKGLHIEARLSDNWLIQPVRDAVRDKAVKGMSFRFSVADGGEKWERRAGRSDLRTLTRLLVPELGPVVSRPTSPPQPLSARWSSGSQISPGSPARGARVAVTLARSPGPARCRQFPHECAPTTTRCESEGC